jgi:drug/metabolite transporter (DMT)-like permease
MIYILPIVAVVCEWIIYGELIKFNTVIGMILIFVGIALAELPKYRSQAARRVE